MTLFDRLGRFVVRRKWWVVGVWAVVLEDLLESPWPDSTVLIPSDGAAKRVRDQEQAGLDLLASVGAFDDDPGTA